MNKTLTGKYRPRNPKKYKGNPMMIEYRSSWELKFMRWADLNESIQEWQSEEKAVWYTSPVDKKKHRYFPDFIIKYERKDGIMVTEMIEVKPASQVKMPPQNPKRRTKSWVYQVKTWMVNQAKWAAATEYCEDRGWSFRIITERELGIQL